MLVGRGVGRWRLCAAALRRASGFRFAIGHLWTIDRDVITTEVFAHGDRDLLAAPFRGLSADQILQEPMVRGVELDRPIEQIAAILDLGDDLLSELRIGRSRVAGEHEIGRLASPTDVLGFQERVKVVALRLAIRARDRRATRCACGAWC